MKKLYCAYFLCLLMVGCIYPKRVPTIVPEWQQKFHIRYINYDSSTHNIVATGRYTTEIKGSEFRRNGFIYYNYDTTYYHYVIDMQTGCVVDTLKDFSGEKTKTTYLSKYSVGERLRKFYLLFEVEHYRYIVAKDYQGYDIAVEEWSKYIRMPHTENNRITVLKKGRVKQLHYIPIVADFLVVDNALYTYSYSHIYKYSFDSIVSKPMHHTTKEKIWWAMHPYIPEMFK